MPKAMGYYRVWVTRIELKIDQYFGKKKLGFMNIAYIEEK